MERKKKTIEYFLRVSIINWSEHGERRKTPLRKKTNKRVMTKKEKQAIKRGGDQCYSGLDHHLHDLHQHFHQDSHR